MKIVLFGITLLISAMSFAAIVPEKTAMYYEANYYKYLNKEIFLNISSMSPSISRDKKLRKGYRYFSVRTYDDKYSGGQMTMLIPSKMTESFVKRFGLIDERDDGKTVTRMLKCVLKMDDNFGLYVIPKEAVKSRPLPSEGERNFEADIMSIASSLSSKAKSAVMKYAKKLAGGDVGDAEEVDE